MSAIEETNKSSTGKIIGWIGCGCLGLVLIAVLAGGGIFYGISKVLKSNAPYTDSIAAVGANPDAISALGEPIKPGFFVSGSINIDNGAGDVDFSIPVSGPKGSGTVRVKGTKPEGSEIWNYDIWELEVEGHSEPILLSK